MPARSDRDLLRTYAETGNETSFANPAAGTSANSMPSKLPIHRPWIPSTTPWLGPFPAQVDPAFSAFHSHGA